MKKILTLGVLSLSLAASTFLIGCTSDSDTSTNTDTLTGYFIDAPVEGLAYKTESGLRGTTDNLGRFQYKKGEKVNFSLGKLDFGEANPTAEGLVSPRELVQNQELVTLMLRTLQALDVDNNPSNGITIPASIITALENISADISMSDLLQESEILDIDTDLSAVLDEDDDGVIDVSDVQAISHFEGSLASWNQGQKPDGTQGGPGQGAHGEGNSFDLSEYPESNLTQEVKEGLAFMGNEERLAYDIYTTLYNYHNDAGTEIRQLVNVSKSERKHVEIVQDIIQRYDLNISEIPIVVDPVANKDVAFEDMPTGVYDIVEIQELYDTLYAKGITSPQSALEVACMVEVTDINDLNQAILIAEDSNATDVVAAYNVLRNGSYNHYWAFDKGLKNMGLAEGCGVAGEEWAKTPQEYPQNSQGGHGTM